MAAFKPEAEARGAMINPDLEFNGLEHQEFTSVDTALLWLGPIGSR